MTYAHIDNNTIDKIGAYPRLEWDGNRWWDLRDEATRTARGWLPIVETNRPADTPEGTHEGSVQLVDGLPVRVWTFRPWTAEELAAQAAAAQYEADRLTIRQIVTDLRTEKARAQAVIDTPNATIKTNPAPYVVDVARAAKRIADAAIDLARYVAP